ncbi:MAG: LysR family transcriptional regulator [Rhizobiaceae bacterium]|nr:LysR family transcriptional regulator [Rhizobiaceae bacterium]
MDTLTRMRAFIEVVEAEGFSAAARKIGRSKALLSKYVRELEDELGALLLNRTTRQFSLTEAGHDYFKRATEIVNDIDALAESVRERLGDVKGRIKLTAPRTFADAGIGHSLIDFARDHPDITLDVHLDDRFVDLVEEGFDIAVRITRMQDSSLIARKLRPFSIRLCGSPELIEAIGRPEKPQDLAGKPCVIDTNGRWLSNWQFKNADGDAITVQVDGRLEVNSPIAAREAAISGLGFVGLPDFIAEPALESGKLVAILDDWLPPAGGIYAVYPHRRYLPAKIRVFVDYLAQWMKTNDTA